MMKDEQGLLYTLSVTTAPARMFYVDIRLYRQAFIGRCLGLLCAGIAC